MVSVMLALNAMNQQANEAHDHDADQLTKVHYVDLLNVASLRHMTT